MNKFFKITLLILFIIMNMSCDKKKGKVVAKVGNENIYQSQIDSIITDELAQLRKEALNSYISKTLFEEEAKIRNISIAKLQELEIIQKAKRVNNEDIQYYTNTNNIVDFDSLQVENLLTNINQRFRFEVFIDSLKTAYNVKLIDNPSSTKLKDMDKLYSHNTNNNQENLKLYFIADYNCPSCQINYQRVFDLCTSFNGKVQFNFVPYSSGIDNKKVFFAEALAMQNKFWELNNDLFKVNQLSDSIISRIIRLYSIDSLKLTSDYNNRINHLRIENNKKILENLNIYSVPTLIIEDVILPGYTSSEELVQIINYKLSN